MGVSAAHSRSESGGDGAPSATHPGAFSAASLTLDVGGSRLQTGLFGGLAFGTIAVAIAYIGPMLGYNAQAAAATVAVGLVALMIHSLRRRDAAAGGQRAVLVAGVLLICAGGIALAALVAAALLLRF